MECMLRIPFPKITVAELCRQCAVSRRVFYYHYASIDACLKSLILRVLSEDAVFVSVHTEELTTREEQVWSFLKYWENQTVFLNTISSSGCFRLFLEAAVDYTMAEEKALVTKLELPDGRRVQDILHFYIGGVFDLLIRWAKKEIPVPTEKSDGADAAHQPGCLDRVGWISPLLAVMRISPPHKYTSP